MRARVTAAAGSNPSKVKNIIREGVTRNDLVKPTFAEVRVVPLISPTTDGENATCSFCMSIAR